jgi:patched 1 protein
MPFFQMAILLIFNLIAMITMYPAMMALDLRRRQRGFIDLCCCVRELEHDKVQPPTVRNKKTFSKTPTLGQQAPPPYSADSASTTCETALSSFSLEGFLDNFYIPFITNGTTKVRIVTRYYCLHFFQRLTGNRSKIQNSIDHQSLLRMI